MLPRLNTRSKMQIASALRGVILGARHMVGLSGSNVVCQRAGISWSLDLNEGIDLSIFLRGSLDRAASAFLMGLLDEGMVAIDIGANIGVYTLPIAQCVGTQGKVFAIEPTDWAFGKLKANLQLNPELQKRVKCHQTALGAAGEAKPEFLYASWDLRGDTDGSGSHPIHCGLPRALQNAEITTLDAFIVREGVQRLDFIKLDVDGCELRVLGGARETFKRFHPKVFFELCVHVLEEQGDSGEALLSYFRDFNYTLHEVRGKSVGAPETIEQLLRKVPNGGSINVLAQ